MIPVAMHLHSTFSDGEFTIRQLRERCSADGFRVALMADHADAFDERTIAQFVAECSAHSDLEFLFVPGMEFSCRDRMHVVGYGVTALLQSDDPVRAIAHIRAHNGLAVIAHPKSAHFDIIEALRPLPHGVEAWNSKYDGRSAPRPATFALVRRMRDVDAAVHAYFGLDLHWRNQFRGLVTHVDSDDLQVASLLAALGSGRYHATCGAVRMESTGELDDELSREFGRRHARAHALRKLLSASKRLVDRMGVPVPASLKAQLRRLF